MRRPPHLCTDDRLMSSGIPLAVVQYSTKINLRFEDRSDCRVIKPSPLGDSPITETLPSKSKGLLHANSIRIGNQRAVFQVVASLRLIDPPPFLDGTLIAHSDVLGELLSKILRECAQDVVEHPTGRGREIEVLRYRVQRD